MGDTRTGRFSGRNNTRWNGNRVSQCPMCFELFSGESTFALHRIEGRSTSGRPGEHFLGPCRNPETKGMELGQNGVWKHSFPGVEAGPQPGQA
jgi:hypothetical protein